MGRAAVIHIRKLTGISMVTPLQMLSAAGALGGGCGLWGAAPGVAAPGRGCSPAAVPAAAGLYTSYSQLGAP